MHDIPSYHVRETRNVNTIQLLSVCKAHKQLKQASKEDGGGEKCISS
jgi:hypothetical protein